jgi:CheY-like chemotaxis protein
MQKLDSLGSLAGGIAHEFNNILTSIVGYSSFLKNLFKKGSKERGYVDKIQRASLGAAKLTSKLLGFARKGKYFEKLIDPNLVIQEVFDIIQKTINKKIKVEINLLPEKRFILADYDQIFQSIMNLVINASDAMESGGTLTISTHIMIFSEDKEFNEEGYTVTKGDYYAITVEDTGIGMSNEIQKKILEPFFTTKPEGKGTGLGLPMVYGVAKNHRGNLFIQSESGKGTKITLTIPLEEKKGVDSISEESGVFPIIKVKDIKKILIVDDDTQILEYLKTVLSEFGYIVDIFSDSNEAYKKIDEQNKKYDLVLLDLILPNFDGEDFVERLKKDKKDVKVLIMTSYPADEKVEKLKLSGINYFLFKPFKISNLINLLKNIFENKEL